MFLREKTSVKWRPPSHGGHEVKHYVDTGITAQCACVMSELVEKREV
jgi:hypothetical protein